MEIVEEEFFEDEQGYKRRRKIRVRKDEFLEEVVHLEASQKFIDEEVNPRIEIGNRHREAEAKYLETEEKFRKWKEEQFGNKEK